VSRQGAYTALVHAQSGTRSRATPLNGAAADQALLRAFPP